MEMVCGFAWFGWATLLVIGLVCCLALSVIAVGILLEVIRRWRYGAREYAAYRIGYQDGSEGLQPLPYRRRPRWRVYAGAVCGAARGRR